MKPFYKRKRFIILASILVLVLIGGLLANSIIAKYVKTAINEEFALVNKTDDYKMSVADVDVNLFGGSITLHDLKIGPTESHWEEFRNGETHEEVLKEIAVNRAALEGLVITNFLFYKDLNIDRIAVEELDFNFIRPKDYVKVENLDREKKSSFSLDSIFIPGIHKVDLEEMLIANYGMHTLNGSNQDTISSYTGSEFKVTGFDMVESSTSGFFEFDNSNIEINLEEQRFKLKGGLYYLAFQQLHYQNSEDLIAIKGFEYAPVESQQAVADSLPFTTDVMDAYVKQLNIHGFKFRSAIVSGAIDVDLVDVDSLNINLFKDKRKPWNLDKRPKLPHESLKQLKQPLHVDSVHLRNTQFVYTERLPDTDTPVRVTIDNIDAKLEYITSIQDSLKGDKPLSLNLKADLLNALPLEANLSMPYNKSQFRFWGTTSGATTFTHINPVVFPAIGIKFQGGTLDGISFDAWATNSHMDGNFILRYTDLEVEIFNKDATKENKTVSWLANSVAKRSNPNKRGKLSVAKINQDRFMYKGIGNFLWKGIQSGVVNSVAPFGNRKSSKR